MPYSTSTATAGSAASEIAAIYDASHTSSGRFSAAIDAIQLSLAQKAVDVATDAMKKQFEGPNNRVINTSV